MSSKDGTIKIHLWAQPRSCSTATMYSFAQRNDAVVLDEPFYAAWLSVHPHLDRPYKDKLYQEQSRDAAKVTEEIETLAKTTDKKIVFVKHITKYLEVINFTPFKNDKHIVLIRNPAGVVTSWSDRVPLYLEELGYFESLQFIIEQRVAGNKPLVIDTDVLLAKPEAVLRKLCSGLGIDFQEEMLKWEAGPKPYDGMWAYHWYKSLHVSTGFKKINQYKVVGDAARELIADLYPVYKSIRKHAICVKEPLASIDVAQDHGLVPLREGKNHLLMMWVGDGLVPRDDAAMSVFDSTVQGGDAVWEGLRIYNGKAFHLKAHLTRLINSAKAMMFADIPTKEFVQHAIFSTLAANNMRDGVHVRFTLSRGEKSTSSMNPKFNVFGSRLVVVAEWKPIEGPATYDNVKGVKLITAANRRNPPQCVDSKIHHCNLINNILPKIQANNAGAADAIMLDLEGFVSETNGTNLFCIREGVLITPHADYCLPGVTRNTIIRIAKEHNIPFEERRVSLSEFHCADEVFTTGTMGEITPVYEIDGRTISEGTRGPITTQIQDIYRKLTVDEGVSLPEYKQAQ